MLHETFEKDMSEEKYLRINHIVLKYIEVA